MAYKRAFTIVELLIVVFVISVLAGLLFVSFSTLTNNANSVAIQSDLTNISKQIQLEVAKNGTYPTFLSDINSGLGVKTTSGSSLIYQYDKTISPYSYCITESIGSVIYSVTQGTSSYKGSCSISGLVTNGMVANYDVPNAASFIGEPTTNQYTNSNFANGLTDWIFGSWNDPVQYTKTTGTVMGPFGSPVTALIINRGSGSATSADFHQGNGGKYISGQSYTLSAYVKGSGTIGKSFQSGFSSSNAGNVTLNGDWQKIEYTVNSSTSTNYPFWAAANISQNSTLYFYRPQSENKSYSTTYVNGTRGAAYGTGGGLIDISGNGFHGDLVNGPIYNSNNQGSISFDGVDDYININPSMLNDASSGTVSMWFNRGAWTSDFTTLFSKSNGGNWINNHVLISRFNLTDTINLTISDNTNSTTNSVTTSTINPSQWYNISMTWDGSKLIGYLNGSEIGRSNTSIKIPNNSTSIVIGKGPVGTGRYFAGLIPSVTMYNRALSASEISQNFNALRGRYGI